MIWLLTGASHTGKTALALRILAARPRLSLSLDLLKMGLIRGGLTALTPEEAACIRRGLPVLRISGDWERDTARWPDYFL